MDRKAWPRILTREAGKMVSPDQSMNIRVERLTVGWLGNLCRASTFSVRGAVRRLSQPNG